MKPKPKQLFFLFALISLAEIGLIATNNQNLRLISKPLIIPLLTACYLSLQIPRKPIMKDYLLHGLFFSWIGDVLLQSEKLFIPGLLAFLTAHIF
jgi:uncharacterized membrane protein YhhN